jgi:hypothetical protein
VADFLSVVLPPVVLLGGLVFLSTQVWGGSKSELKGPMAFSKSKDIDLEPRYGPPQLKRPQEAKLRVGSTGGNPERACPVLEERRPAQNPTTFPLRAAGTSLLHYFSSHLPAL